MVIPIFITSGLSKNIEYMPLLPKMYTTARTAAIIMANFLQITPYFLASSGFSSPRLLPINATTVD